ncbi:MAG: hypothetical protein WBG89_00315 [Ornithinimicrobium sp.]
MTSHELHGDDDAVGARDGAETQQERHDREVRESLREERRLLRWEVLCLLLVVVFVVVRQLWLT